MKDSFNADTRYANIEHALQNAAVIIATNISYRVNGHSVEDMTQNSSDSCLFTVCENDGTNVDFTLDELINLHQHNELVIYTLAIADY